MVNNSININKMNKTISQLKPLNTIKERNPRPSFEEAHKHIVGLNWYVYWVYPLMSNKLKISD
jgi:hypothetical protein